LPLVELQYQHFRYLDRSELQTPKFAVQIKKKFFSGDRFDGSFLPGSETLVLKYVSLYTIDPVDLN